LLLSTAAAAAAAAAAVFPATTQTMSSSPSPPSVQFPLVIGQERLLNEFSRVPKHDDLWMVYFNINDSKFTRMLATFCRIVAEPLE
jgi:hypothetical protein